MAMLRPIIIALVLVSAFASGLLAQPATTSLAIVLKVSGEVSQRTGDGAVWKAANRGQALSPGHQVRTGPTGFCAIMFRDDRSLLKVSASTEVRLDAQPAPGGKFSKKLWVGVGGVWAQVTKQEGTDFRIETPTSVASVKGTQGYDIVDASGYTTLFGLAGVWNFTNPYGSVDIAPGFQAFSNGIDPPILTQTPPGAAPVFGMDNVPGLEAPGYGGTGSTSELRLGLEEEDGTHRTLVVRYREHTQQ